MNASERDFLSEASSTICMIREAVDAPNSCVVLILITPSDTMHPDCTASPTDAWSGADSPVRDDVSRSVSPSATIPSIGIRSPGRTVISVPIGTSLGSTFLIPPFPSSTFA